MEPNKSFKGPQIRWNIDDTILMTQELGVERAIERIAYGLFDINYVREKVHEIRSNAGLE